MEVVSGIMVYLILWWMVFFMVLPWGIESVPNPQPGLQHGAPLKPKLWMKAAVTTGVSSTIFYILYLFVPTDMLQWAIFQQ